jgi:methylase of polypeptide subunit release factors
VLIEETPPHPTATTSRVATFGPIVVEFDEQLLEPRDWTIEQSAWAAELAATAAPGPILELYAGAGHIGLAAAKLSGRSLVQVDDSAHACTWAARNAQRAAIDSDVRCANVEAALTPDERFAVVIADPPYLRTDQVARYPGDPRHAIDGGDDGLVEIERGLHVIATHTTPDAAALLQVRGPKQCRAITALLSDARIPLRVADTRTISRQRAIVLLQPTISR